MSGAAIVFPLDPRYERSKGNRVSLSLSAEADTLSAIISAPVLGDSSEAIRYRSDFGNDLSVKFSVRMDLKRERGLLNDALDALYSSSEGHVLLESPLRRLEPATLRRLLTPLAEQGRSVYRRLFTVKETDDFRESDLPLVQAVLDAALEQAATLEVRCPEPLFPWALLFSDRSFDRYCQTTLNPASFFGFRFQLEQKIRYTSSRLRLEGRPRLLSAVCPKVDEGRHALPLHPFSLGRSYVTPIRDVPALMRELERLDASCLYFFGHAHHEAAPTPTSSWIKLGLLELKVSDLQEQDISFVRDPVLTFINGCGAARLEVWDETTLLGYLSHQTDRRICCVGTVGKIPEAFAYSFARRFFNRFLLRGQSVGEALLEARRRMLKHFNNPLGLLYTAFGRLETRIENPPSLAELLKENAS